MKFISGSLPNPEDYEGCVIDENVAYELFGTSRVVGNFLTYQGKKYCIRGIIISKEPIFMIHIYNKEHAYSNLELVYEDKGDGKQLVNDFMVQNALADDYTMVEGCFYAKMLELLYRIPAWFLGFYLLYQLLKCIWKRRTLPLQVLVLLIGFVALWCVLNYLMEFQVYIPERMIPTKWSDFSFWTEKYTAFQDVLKQITYLTPVPKDVILIEYTKRCIYYILISLVCMIVFVTHRKGFLGENSGIMMSLLAIVMECAAILILFKTGKVFSFTRGYFCMIPFYIMSFDFKKRGQELWNLLRNKELKEINNRIKQSKR